MGRRVCIMAFMLHDQQESKALTLRGVNLYSNRPIARVFLKGVLK